MPRLRLPGTVVITQVSSVGWGHWGLHLSTLQGGGHGDGGSVGAQNERLCRSTPDPHSTEMDPRVPANRAEPEEWGLGVQQPSESTSEHTSSSGLDGLDVHGLVPSERPKGECWCSGFAVACVDCFQLRKKDGLTTPSGGLHLRLISRRGRLKHLLPSRLLCNLSPFSVRNIRFVLAPCSRSPSYNPTCRTLLLLRTRFKYFSCASLHWRSFLRGLQVMRRK